MSQYQKMVLNYIKAQKKNQLENNNILSKQKFNQQSFNQKFDNYDQEVDQFLNTSQQANVKIPYKPLKPRLIQSLLSFKDQMLQQMDIKKQLFQSKTVVKQQSFKQQKYLKSKEIIKTNQNLNNNQQNESQQKSKKKVRLRKKSSYISSQHQGKQFIDTKGQKQIICLQKNQKQIQISYLQKFQEQQSTIMNRLLDIIQKEKQKSLYNSIYQSKVVSHPSSVSRKVSRSRQNHQKAIIINNYMKPQQSKVDEELMKKQLKIKLLQIQRQNKRNQIISSQKQSRITIISKQKDHNNSIENEKKQQKTNLTSNNSQLKEFNQQLNYKKIQSSVNEFLIQSVKGQSISFNDKQIKKQQIEKLSKKQLFVSTHQQQNYKSEIEGNIPHTPINQIIQHNQTLQKQVKQLKQNLKNNLCDNKVSQCPQIFKDETRKIQQKLQRRPVLFQIPISQNQSQSISLAQAFKKKMKNCKLATQKRQDQRIIRKNYIKAKKQNLSTQKDKQNIPDSQRNHNQTDLTYRCTEDYNQFIPDKPNIEETKRTNKTVIPKKNVKQIKFDSVQSIQSSIASPRQPSKQLLDRLIYGNKAKIDKKQMYALTKKNYQRLPQVENKRKMEEKKAKQLQRLQKIKDFQKQIRSSKSSLKN